MIISALLLFSMCARIGRPTGGPKDVTPPKVTSATPPNYTTNFNKDKIEIYSGDIRDYDAVY
ncbi:MAG: hypothetical protein ACOCW8_00920, partial [bacterium]